MFGECPKTLKQQGSVTRAPGWSPWGRGSSRKIWPTWAHKKMRSGSAFYLGLSQWTPPKLGSFPLNFSFPPPKRYLNKSRAHVPCPKICNVRRLPPEWLRPFPFCFPSFGQKKHGYHPRNTHPSPIARPLAHRPPSPDPRNQGFPGLGGRKVIILLI